MNDVGYWNETYNCIRKSWINELDDETLDRFRNIPYNERFTAYKALDSMIFERFVETLSKKRSEGTLNDIKPSSVKFKPSEDSKPNRVFQVIHEATVEFIRDLNIDYFLASYETVRGSKA